MYYKMYDEHVNVKKEMKETTEYLKAYTFHLKRAIATFQCGHFKLSGNVNDLKPKLRSTNYTSFIFHAKEITLNFFLLEANHFPKQYCRSKLM